MAKKGNFRLINGSSCIEKPLGKLHTLGNSVHTQFNTEQIVTTEFPDKHQPLNGTDVTSMAIGSWTQ